MSTFNVWYMRPGQDRVTGQARWNANNIMGAVDPKNLDYTHTFLKNVEADNHNEVFDMMQGEVWSPNGEARLLIWEKGLEHTSMSVGDIVVDDKGEVFMVDTFGWQLIHQKGV